MNLENESSISKPGIFKKIRTALQNFTLTEKVIFGLFLFLLIASILSVLVKVNSRYLVEVPQRGGEIREGVIGTPRFINPVIAISDTDRDIASLVYSGLIKIDSEGNIQNDLAENISVSEDGLTYSVKIRDDAFFHDGEAVTTDDIIFTIQKTQDPKIKSPKRPNWDGVSVQKISDKEIEFTLSQPYSPFIYNLTMGVLPEHIWEDISSEEFAFSKYNLEPIGSGPFVIDDVNTDRDGIAKKYVLEGYENYTLGEPYLKKISFNFYKNEDELIKALNEGDVTSAHSVSPKRIEELELKKTELLQSPFSRIFALYFNQANNLALSDITVREVLNKITPKEEVVGNVMGGFAKEINSPIPANNNDSVETLSIEEAKQVLLDEGWQEGEDGILVKETDESITRLEFSISTANVEELVEVSQLIADKYKELGADVSVKIFEPNDLTLNVIRPREFESIFFGQVINRDKDFYAFWHSSQRNDPGLNIAGFTNIDADASLENLRTLFDEEEKERFLQIFEKEVINELPAIFLYSPDFIYIVSEDLNLEIPNSIVTASDRFTDVEKWYKETDLVWEIFAK